MTRNHLKRLCAPPTWGILRKEHCFITRPQSGPHRLEHCLPLSVVLKHLKIATTTREVKKMLLHNPVLIDGKHTTIPKAQVGLMDELAVAGQHVRILFDHNGHLAPTLMPASESGRKPCKVTGFTMSRGAKLQLHTQDGRNIFVQHDHPYHVGDTILIATPTQAISGHYKLEIGAFVYLTGGKHLGDAGIVTSIKDNTIAYQTSAGQEYTTLKHYAFVLGKGKPAITLPSKTTRMI